jgi:hypothetical protein
MPKRRVPPEQKRLIISARVTPPQRDTLLIVGEGNISRGLDRIMMAWTRKQAAANPPGATR